MTDPGSYYRTRSATIMADWLKAKRFDRIVSAFKRSPLLKFVLGGGAPFSPIPAPTISRMYAEFRSEVEELEEMLQRDLSEWKSETTSTNVFAHPTEAKGS